jgi:hypothetical protein
VSRPWRVCVGAAAALLAALGLFGDAVAGHAPGVGPLQGLLLTLAALLLPLTLLSGAWLHRHAALVSVLVSVYATLLAFELALTLALGPDRNRSFALSGVYQPTRWGGYELIPGWHGFYDDGRTRVAVDINAQGARDDEPERQPRAARQTLLLLGDSQTFGMGLDRAQTIERQIETLSAGEVAAYDLGVPGYGPEDSLEHYREHAAPVARHTFFLLYGNDLRQDNCRAGFHTAFEGFIVTRDRPDGTRRDPGELRRGLVAAKAAASAVSWISGVKGILLLEQLRRRVEALRDPDAFLLLGQPSDFPEDCPRSAARAAGAMAALARERGQAFEVVVLPTVLEAMLQRYAQPMRACLRELQRLSLPTLEVRALLSAADYLPRDEHLAASGASKVAAAILRETLRSDRSDPR